MFSLMIRKDALLGYYLLSSSTLNMNGPSEVLDVRQ